jgi:hypothetical protein
MRTHCALWRSEPWDAGFGVKGQSEAQDGSRWGVPHGTAQQGWQGCLDPSPSYLYYSMKIKMLRSLQTLPSPGSGDRTSVGHHRDITRTSVGHHSDGATLACSVKEQRGG